MNSEQALEIAKELIEQKWGGKWDYEVYPPHRDEWRPNMWRILARAKLPSIGYDYKGGATILVDETTNTARFD
jgi:hypothetical protein